ncbi:MAG: N-acetylglucosamine-6-phosphate deacetylase, partial [Gemmatimonadales bacterium]
MASYLITGARLCTDQGVVERGWLLTADGRVAGLGAGRLAVKGPAPEPVDAAGLVLMPGFVDVHVHGGDGADVMDADPEGLARMARFHAAHGTTAVVPTTWAASPDDVRAAVNAVAAVTGPVEGGATIVGVHLEGPWINPARAGAQDRAQIRPPDLAEARGLLDSGIVRLVTLAPELEGSAAVIAECRSRGVTVSAGHTEATFAQMQAAVDLGLGHVTHTFNAMPSLHHRESGILAAALTDDRFTAEIIADGVHVDPAVV